MPLHSSQKYRKQARLCKRWKEIYVQSLKRRNSTANCTIRKRNQHFILSRGYYLSFLLSFEGKFMIFSSVKTFPYLLKLAQVLHRFQSNLTTANLAPQILHRFQDGGWYKSKRSMSYLASHKISFNKEHFIIYNYQKYTSRQHQSRLPQSANAFSLTSKKEDIVTSKHSKAYFRKQKRRLCIEHLSMDKNKQKQNKNG